MSFFDKVRIKLAQFMRGRNGMDTIVITLLWVWPILYILGLVTSSGVLILLSNVVMVYMLFRMFSRNVEKRRAENILFWNKTQPIRKKMGEWRSMFKNRKNYAYFSCPKCKAKLRLPRGVGSVTVTCKQCGDKFEKKA